MIICYALVIEGWAALVWSDQVEVVKQQQCGFSALLAQTAAVLGALPTESTDMRLCGSGMECVEASWKPV